jgi:phosphate uptake regulator
MSCSFDDEMKSISSKLKQMLEMVLDRFTEAIESFEDLDQDRAEGLAFGEDESDALHYQIEDVVFRLSSKHGPEGQDLRRLMAYLYTSISLRRVSGYARKISETVGLCDGLDHFKELESIPYLSDIAKAALQTSLRAVLDADLSEIDQLEKLEAQSDHELSEMFDEISDFLRQRKDIGTIAMCYMIVGRYCERAADEAISIAEAAVYLVDGEHRKLGEVYKGVDEEEFI